MSDETQSEAPRKPGRPPKSEAAAASRPRPNDEMAKRRAERKQRGVTDHGHDKRLALDESKIDNANFTHRWVRDDPGRVRRLQDREWEIVPAEEVKGQDVARHGGLSADGKAMQAVLMRKWRPWHNEDQAEKLKLGKEQDAALIKGKSAALTEGGGGFDYVPPNNSLTTVGVQVSRSDRSEGEYNP